MYVFVAVVLLRWDLMSPLFFFSFLLLLKKVNWGCQGRAALCLPASGAVWWSPAVGKYMGSDERWEAAHHGHSAIPDIPDDVQTT